jgi:hypothetical protein
MTAADHHDKERVLLLNPATIAACRAVLTEEERGVAWMTAIVAWDTTTECGKLAAAVETTAGLLALIADFVVRRRDRAEAQQIIREICELMGIRANELFDEHQKRFVAVGHG